MACSIAAAAAMLVGSAARAQAVMVEAGDQRLREDLQWLADRGVIQLSTSFWPLPLAAIESALAARRPDASMADLDAIAAVQREIERQKAPLAAGVALRANTASIPATTFERPVRSDAEVDAWIQASRGPLAGRLEVRGLSDPLTSRQSHVNLEGTYVAGRLGGHLLYAGQVAHWWGPGQDGSLIWSNAGLAIPGFGLRRAEERPFETRWLSWLGPWSYEVFVGQMLHNRLVSGTKIFAMRFQAEPLPGLELGASRLIQWGGSVGSNSFRSLVDAFLARSNDENGAVNNEIAGFDARYTWKPGGNPLTLYGQFIGEDEAHLAPTGYLALVGLQFKHLLARSRMQWTLETADTKSGRMFGLREGNLGSAYAHTQFRDGMYHEGLPIAHFIGGEGRATSFGVNVAPVQNPFRLRYGFRFLRADVNPLNQAINLAFPASDTVKLLQLNASWDLRAFGARTMTVHAGFDALRTRRGGRDNGLRLALELPL